MQSDVFRNYSSSQVKAVIYMQIYMYLQKKKEKKRKKQKQKQKTGQDINGIN